MADIHLARPQNDDNTLVVLKRIRAELATDPRMVQMFLDEASIAASLRHPNVARTLDVDRANGHFYFAMEFLRGANVWKFVRRLALSKRTLPLQHALAIVIGACRGLHYAHEMRNEDDGSPLGIVHRDISPQNIFVTYEGVPKLVDFGIAKAATSFAKTRPGSLKGKLHYMSPEQCLSENLDRRTDIFSLAIILWELTTGVRLFRGRCELEVMTAIVESEARRPSSVHPGYPAELERIVMRGLRRSVGERYQTVEEMQHDLELFVATANLDVSDASLSCFISDVFSDEVGIDELSDGPADQIVPEYDDDSDGLACVVVSTDEDTARLRDEYARRRQVSNFVSLVAYLSLLAALCVLLMSLT